MDILNVKGNRYIGVKYRDLLSDASFRAGNCLMDYVPHVKLIRISENIYMLSYSN